MKSIVIRIYQYYSANGFMNVCRKISASISSKYLPKMLKQQASIPFFEYLLKNRDQVHVEHEQHDRHEPCEHVIKYIAFYLPQFHPIPENDEWWGKGFTEWVNVTKALPQFEGHYQPKIPSELGYYDLRVNAVRTRQVELAKNYGIHGFCYHYYWFSGKKLLDYPLEKLLKDKSIDFPFCINWANENWTRRWDGKENEVLLAQQYADSDYLNFIKDILPILKDHRYIKVDGKPLLMVYKTSLIPDVSKMASIWRSYCRSEGLGELHLVLTHSIKNINPEHVGFDAAVEFAPNNFPFKNVKEEAKYFNKSFTGNQYDYKSAIDIAKSYQEPSYLKYRCVCPSWDNEARRIGNGTVLCNAAPSIYRQWLDIVSEQTLLNRKPENRLVFINAWNEWAEGAFIEPDNKFGYAYLEATYSALKKIKWKESALVGGEMLGEQLAIVIHAYYTSLLVEIIDYIKETDLKYTLYVTTPLDQEDDVKKMLVKAEVDHVLIAVENKGRDILPFIKIMQRVMNDGFEIVLKLHTKKSSHRNDGDEWRRDLLTQLLSVENSRRAVDLLRRETGVGMVGPANHVISMDQYIGSNGDRVFNLSKKLGFSKEEVEIMPFVASTMFYVKVVALVPLLDLKLSSCDFEVESGQIDGAMEHAVERMFSVSVYASGQTIVASKNLNVDDLMDINNDYKYAH